MATQSAADKRPSVPRLAYSVGEVAEALGISRATVNAHIASGTIPSVKLGGLRLIRREVLDSLLGGDEPNEATA